MLHLTEYLFLDGYIPHVIPYGIYMLQHIRFAKARVALMILTIEIKF